ncbi:type VI secretion system protein TssA [Acidiphilium sp. PA]|uniref:type VI secretion system protein TssA n=1 Tax=Acidiphilium sp. PA TaxID=2871705 RepID=UPI0022448E81|nr:type VI secretion system protein TssA [Acidiphilium sp. PA]MCW8307699.1 type VI secretion system protein TssA [Acidiphilium sp. PA]
MTLDMTHLLEPIAAEAPSGVDLRADYTAQSVYYRLRDARSDARAAERAADADTALEPEVAQHWRVVLQLSQTALAKSHDLEIAAWLTEALVRDAGLAGLADGAALIAGYAARYWESVFPLPDEDGMEIRTAPIAGLNGVGGDGTLIQPLRKLPLFNTADGARVLLFQYQQAEETAGLGDAKRKAARIAAGVADFAKLETEARAVGVAHFTTLAQQAIAALAAWRDMAQTLDAAAGADAPPASRVGEILEQIINIARRYAPQAGAPVAIEAGPIVAEDEPMETGMADAPITRGAVRTREDALRQLTEIAEFFRRTEPQSPIALTLDEAVRRARLPWPQLIEDILADAAVRQAMLTALGIKPAG